MIILPRGEKNRKLLSKSLTLVYIICPSQYDRLWYLVRWLIKVKYINTNKTNLKSFQTCFKTVHSAWTGPKPRLASLALAGMPAQSCQLHSLCPVLLAPLASLALMVLLNATQKVKSLSVNVPNLNLNKVWSVI